MWFYHQNRGRQLESFGSPESNATSSTTSAQTTVQGGGAGSTTNTAGSTSQNKNSPTAYNSGAASGTTFGAVGRGGSQSDTINYVSSDPEVAEAAIDSNSDLAGYGIQAEGQTATAALNANNQVTQGALGLGAEAVDAATAATVNANYNNALTTQSFLTLGAESLQSVNNLASQNSSQSAAEIQQANTNSAAIANELAGITANAAPQTTAAETENLNGSSPISTVTNSSKLSTLLAIAGGIAVLYVFFKSGGKNA